MAVVSPAAVETFFALSRRSVAPPVATVDLRDGRNDHR
jgi:hypothetical protein